MKRYRVVETRSVFMHRYLVEEDVDIHENEILELIQTGELEEVMQEHLGESIHAVSLMTLDEFITLNNGYLSQYDIERQKQIALRYALKNET